MLGNAVNIYKRHGKLKLFLGGLVSIVILSLFNIQEKLTGIAKHSSLVYESMNKKAGVLFMDFKSYDKHDIPLPLPFEARKTLYHRNGVPTYQFSVDKFENNKGQLWNPAIKSQNEGILKESYKTSYSLPKTEKDLFMKDAGNPYYTLPICPPVSPHLKGRVNIVENISVREVEGKYDDVVTRGGSWWPNDCEARWRVAIIIPYRNRKQMIGPFLNHMHPFLQRQQLNYTIYFVEQEGNDPFNRAKLLNVGFVEAEKNGPYDCYAFHDVDMLPENDNHLYHCSPQPRHLAVATSTYDYKDSDKAKRNTYYGGACLMTPQQIRKVNGWSNIYWGWGGEDNDMWERIQYMDMRVWRFPGAVARYRAMKHKLHAGNADRYEILANCTSRIQWDGLSNLNYTLIKTTNLPLYTHILTYIGKPSQVHLVPAEKDINRMVT